MAEYMNPFAGSILPENVPNNPFVSRFNQLDNREYMAPFVNMEKQRQEQKITEDKFKFGEFTSPEAVEHRLTEKTSGIARNKFEAAEADSKLRLLPDQEKLKLLELRGKMQSEEAKPYAELFKAFGDAALILEKTPAQMRPAAWAQIVSRWQQQHPNTPIPEQYRNYSPQLLQETGNVRLAQILTPQHEQEIKKLNVQKEWEIKKANVQAGATLGAARIHEEGANKRFEKGLTENAKQNPGQFKVSNMKVLNDPKSTPEQIEVAEANLNMFATEQINKIWKEDGMLTSLETKALFDPNAAQLYDKRKAKLFEDYVVDQGIRVRVVAPDGKTKGTILKSKLKAALEAGYKEAK